jgi:hypothetical protein
MENEATTQADTIRTELTNLMQTIKDSNATDQQKLDIINALIEYIKIL